MRLEKSLFEIDAPAYVERLCDFIRTKRSELNRGGILVACSGGLDSSTVLLLCARAVGKDSVKALVMPEKQGNPEAEKYARLVTERFGIEAITRDITPLLQKLGVYNFILSQIPARPLQEWTAKAYLHRAKKNPFLQITQGRADAMERRGFARFNTKHRLRAVIAYLLAEELNYLVVGCAHKSEDMLGLYVKFGVDDIADLMPIKNLYRSQILQLAAYLDVPEEIIQRTPNPDIIPGVSDKYLDILGLPSETLDLLVYGIEHGLQDGDLSAQLSLPLEKVQEIRALIAHTEHMRRPSQTIDWTE